MVHCTAQNKPKRFKQPYFSATATHHEQAVSFLTFEENRKVEGCSGKTPQCVNA